MISDDIGLHAWTLVCYNLPLEDVLKLVILSRYHLGLYMSMQRFMCEQFCLPTPQSVSHLSYKDVHDLSAWHRDSGTSYLKKLKESISKVNAGTWSLVAIRARKRMVAYIIAKAWRIRTYRTTSLHICCKYWRIGLFYCVGDYKKIETSEYMYYH